MLEEKETHLLADEFESQKSPAGAGKRFANYIIDLIACYIFSALMGVVVFVTGIITVNDSGAQFTFLFLNILSFFLAWFAMEAIFKGKSLGKLITKTRAVNEADGSKITVRTAFLRSLCRLVPFEPLSGLGSPTFPWHDKWTGTVVVED
jgi:uncharacterized RDD family membrane protein YckC